MTELIEVVKIFTVSMLFADVFNFLPKNAIQPKILLNTATVVLFAHSLSVIVSNTYKKPETFTEAFVFLGLILILSIFKLFKETDKTYDV